MLRAISSIAKPGDLEVALITLTVLEIVLGIDNVIFISILSGALPGRRAGARPVLGRLLAAMVTRILLLVSLVWLIAA